MVDVEREEFVHLCVAASYVGGGQCLDALCEVHQVVHVHCVRLYHGVAMHGAICVADDVQVAYLGDEGAQQCRVGRCGAFVSVAQRFQSGQFLSGGLGQGLGGILVGKDVQQAGVGTLKIVYVLHQHVGVAAVAVDAVAVQVDVVQEQAVAGLVPLLQVVGEAQLGNGAIGRVGVFGVGAVELTPALEVDGQVGLAYHSTVGIEEVQCHLVASVGQ